MAVALPRQRLRLGASLRIPLLALAAVRMAFGVVAALVAPMLWEQHFTTVVLMRPTKEVLLAAGFKLRLGDIGLVPVLASVVPLGVLGVWLFYFLGRAFADEIQGGEGLPSWADRILPTKRISQLCDLLEHRGQRVVVFGRLAVFPSTLMAAAAGASAMPMRRFLIADGIGAAVSTAMVLLVGFVLGEAYEEAGPWLTAVGGVVTIGLLVALGRWLRQSEPRAGSAQAGGRA